MILFIMIIFMLIFIGVILVYSKRNKTYNIDWSVKDVLVGSLGSIEQFNDNIARKYYYVPAKYVLADRFPINYIAIYQSKRMFDDACISYYGRITKTKQVKRKNIDFPLRRNNGEEMYYAFRIQEWKKLSHKISGKYDYIAEPRFTNMFLLQNCTESYELFCVDSDDKYRLLLQIKRMIDDVFKNPKHKGVYRINNKKSIQVGNGCFNIFDKNKKELFRSSIKISDYTYNPRGYFKMIADRVIKE